MIIQSGSYEGLLSDPETELSLLLREHKSAQAEPDAQQKSESHETRDSSAPHISPTAPSNEDSEVSAEGRVKFSVMSEYFRAGSTSALLGYLTTAVSRQVLAVGASVWLKNWAQHNLESPSDSNRSGTLIYYLAFYFLFGFSSAFANSVSSFFAICVWGIRAARKLHDLMFTAVVRSPLRFFETTPSGAIQSRFSHDVATVDERLPVSMAESFSTIMAVIGVLVVITWSTPLFALAIIPLTWLYLRIQAYFMASSRELKRLESSTRSPVFNHIQESVVGASTIRAYGQQTRFINTALDAISLNHRAGFLATVCNSWLAIRLELLSAVVILSSAALAGFSLIHFRSLDPAQIGLMLSYALSSTRLLTWILHGATDVETNAIAVERIQQYIRLPPEVTPDAKAPPAGWPCSGTLEFRNVSARYQSGGPLVLKDVSFRIASGERVGVVGRTGAGKSSLTLALYRILPSESGAIVIDGVDAATVTLETLRSSLSIIPQDAQCFQGPLRFNLDPTRTASDDELWAALSHASLKAHVEALDGGLDAPVEEGGGNLSAGQRQLLCLARALLRRSKILVVDEGTSSVDLESDKIGFCGRPSPAPLCSSSRTVSRP